AALPIPYKGHEKNGTSRAAHSHAPAPKPTNKSRIVRPGHPQEAGPVERVGCRSSDRLFPGSDGASVTTVVPHFAIQVAPTMNMRQEHLHCRRNTPSPSTWKCLMGSMSLQWAPDVAPLGGVP